MDSAYDWTEDARKAASALGVASDIHPEDMIFRWLITNPVFKEKQLAVKYYLNDGKRSSEIFDGLVTTLLDRPDRPLSVLEFASGYGCVSRHWKTFGDKYEVVACDIHPQAVDFIATKLGVAAIVSNKDPAALKIGRQFDIVFALSFFSHMPARSWERWVRSLLNVVSPNGLLIFTTQGLKSRVHLGEPTLDDEGYWFSPESEQKDLPTEEYGQTIVTPSFVFARLARIPEAHPIYFREASWWNHQDTYAVRKG